MQFQRSDNRLKGRQKDKALCIMYFDPRNYCSVQCTESPFYPREELLLLFIFLFIKPIAFTILYFYCI